MTGMKIPLRFSSRCFFSLLLCLAFVSLTACGPRKIGYGVLLWSPDEGAIETGTLLPVYEESRIRASYTVPVRGAKETLELPTWRIQFFPKEKEAAAFAEGFARVKGVYATSNRRALPVREKADRLSRRVYRLRENEKMKVLELGTEPADENGLEGFWYKVLTSEGVSGYCFDYHLTVFDVDTHQTLSATRDPAKEAVATILSTLWKPAYFRDMIAEKRIDPARFKSSFGLFFIEEPRQMRISLPSGTVAIPYTQIRKTGGEAFIAEGSDVQFQLRGGGSEIVVFYTAGGNRRSDIFIPFESETDIEEILAKETERRTEILSDFLSRGRILRSSAYGEITFAEDGSFNWTDFERLVPAAIPKGTQGTGKIEFSVFIGREIKEKYDGVATFRFGGTKTSFLYRYTDGGVRFVHVPPANIEDGVVRRESMNSLVVFFATS